MRTPPPFGACDFGLLEPFDPSAMERVKAASAQQQLLIAAAAAQSSSHSIDTSDDQDPNCLHDTGWGVIFPRDMDHAVVAKLKDALAPLFDLRFFEIYGFDSKPEARVPEGEEDLFRIFEGGAGYREGDDAAIWLDRQGVDLGQVDAKNGVPFYLLIVASPEDIPFDFQTGLDSHWGVGRIWFAHKDGQPDYAAFRRYAESVHDYEKLKRSDRAKKFAAVYATRHAGDPATGSLMEQLILPLLDPKTRLGVGQGFGRRAFLGGDDGPHTPGAGREILGQLLNGQLPEGRPALVFTGCHGRFPDYQSNPEYHELLGALIAQEWDGTPPPADDVVFAARNLEHSANLHGTIHFMFACFGLGSPQFDTYSKKDKQIAPGPILSPLPQKMLCHPNGALAVFSHVDRAYASCWQTEDEKPQISGFRGVLSSLMRGDRVGNATDQFNLIWGTRYALVDSAPDHETRALRWLRSQDARAFAVFGDPAVRLLVNQLEPLKEEA